MASATRISNVTAIAMLQALADQLNGGSLGAVIQVRTIAPPTNVEDTPVGAELANLTCAVAMETSILDGTDKATLTADTITSDVSATATGEAGHFIAGDSSVSETIATRVIHGTAGVAADTPDLTFDDDMIVIGGTVAITAWTIDMPET